MNYVLSVINPYGANIMKKICEELNLPIVLSSPCKGTATRNMLDLYVNGGDEVKKYIY